MIEKILFEGKDKTEGVRFVLQPMNRQPELRKYLLDEYGIRNDKELEEAFKKLKPIDIGIFVSQPPARNKEEVRQGA